MKIPGTTLLVAALVLVSGRGRAETAEPVRTSIICEAPPGPGRFRCDVELRVREGTLSWADVQVVTVDDFVLPLRGRLGPREASTHESDIYRWSLGFVAKGRGTGNIKVRVRAVLCHGDSCIPVENDVVGEVVVGR